MESWNSLVRMASLGTARTGRELPALDFADCPDELRLALRQESGESPSRILLRHAALLTMARRAGYRAAPVCVDESTSTSRELATTAPRQVCPPAAAVRLVSILANRRHLLPEWLDLLDQMNGQIPEGLLPEILEVGREQPELRPILSRLIGERGRWLAGLNSSWAWADAQVPAPGPEGAADPFPSPESLAAARELLFSLVTLRKQALERTTIEIRRPTPREQEQLERLLPPADPEGEKSIHLDSPLAQLLAGLNPVVLLEAWAVEAGQPDKIVRAAARSVEREMLLAALTEATARWKALDWVEPLIAERLSEPTEEGLDIFHLLPAARQEHWILQALRRSDNLEVDQPAFWLLTRSSTVWGRRVAAQLWPLMLREVEGRSTTVTWDWRILTAQAALRLDPRMAAEAAAFFAEVVTSASPLVPDLVRLLDDLAFRSSMASELRRRSR